MLLNVTAKLENLPKKNYNWQCNAENSGIKLSQLWVFIFKTVNIKKLKVLKKKDFIYLRVRECECEWGGAGGYGGEAEVENLKQTPWWAHSPVWGLISQPRDHDLSQNEE